MTNLSLSPLAVSTMLALSLVIGAADGFYSYRLTKTQQRMEAAVSQHEETLQNLNHGITEAKNNYLDLQGEMTFAKDRLGMTQVELRKAQQSSTRLARQQKEADQKWGSQLGQIQEQQAATQGTVGNLSSDMAGVKDGLSSTRTDLQRVVGDLGVQSGLIARNGEELAELRLRGERDYFEFDVAGKNKHPQRFGPVSIALKKADVKRQRYTINLVADDRTIEKKEKTVNEPVQFYEAGYRVPTEIVVNQIYKDRIVGYVSVPKKRETQPARTVSSTNGKLPFVADSK